MQLIDNAVFLFVVFHPSSYRLYLLRMRLPVHGLPFTISKQYLFYRFSGQTHTEIFRYLSICTAASQQPI